MSFYWSSGPLIGHQSSLWQSYRYYSINSYCIAIMQYFRFKIPNVYERHRRDSEGRTLTSNLVYTIWAVFGGFILHFLLCNFLTVLLRPRYEEPVETTKDLIKRDITPFYAPVGEIWRQFFAASNDTIYQEISQRLTIAKDWDEWENMVSKVTSTGMCAFMGTYPPWIVPEEEFKDWYRSTETISGHFPFSLHLTNKKWPLKKVLDNVICQTNFDSLLSEL